MITRNGSRWVFAAACLLGFAAFNVPRVHAESLSAVHWEVQSGVGAGGFAGANTHVLAGGSVHVAAQAGLRVGAEVFYWSGSGTDRDVTIVPLLSYEFRRESTVHPYVIGGIGLLYHRMPTGAGSSWWTGATYGAGAGLKMDITRRFYVAPEVRLGWEPVTRASLSVGYRF